MGTAISLLLMIRGWGGGKFEYNEMGCDVLEKGSGTGCYQQDVLCVVGQAPVPDPTTAPLPSVPHLQTTESSTQGLLSAQSLHSGRDTQP